MHDVAASAGWTVANQPLLMVCLSSTACSLHPCQQGTVCLHSDARGSNAVQYGLVVACTAGMQPRTHRNKHDTDHLVHILPAASALPQLSNSAEHNGHTTLQR